MHLRKQETEAWWSRCGMWGASAEAGGRQKAGKGRQDLDIIVALVGELRKLGGVCVVGLEHGRGYVRAHVLRALRQIVRHVQQVLYALGRNGPRCLDALCCCCSGCSKNAVGDVLIAAALVFILLVYGCWPFVQQQLFGRVQHGLHASVTLPHQRLPTPQ